jgi:hypothetical protein
MSNIAILSDDPRNRAGLIGFDPDGDELPEKRSARERRLPRRGSLHSEK